MKKFLVHFAIEIEVETEEQAYDALLGYLKECVRHEDVTAFGFQEVKAEESNT